MSVELDELFAGERPPPPAPDPTPRLVTWSVVAAGVNVVALLGGAGAFVLSGAAELYAAAGSGAMPMVAAEALGWGVYVGLGLYLLLVPSVLASLYLWHRAGEELDRVRSGALPRSCWPGLRRLRRALIAWLGGQAVSMMIQTWLIGWLTLAATRSIDG